MRDYIIKIPVQHTNTHTKIYILGQFSIKSRFAQAYCSTQSILFHLMQTNMYTCRFYEGKPSKYKTLNTVICASKHNIVFLQRAAASLHKPLWILVCDGKHKTTHSNICLKPSCYLGASVYAQPQEVQVDIELSLGTSPSGSIQSNSIYDQTHACFLHCLPSFIYIQHRLDTFIEPVKNKYTRSNISHINVQKQLTEHTTKRG